MAMLLAQYDHAPLQSATSGNKMPLEELMLGPVGSRWSCSRPGSDSFPPRSLQRMRGARRAIEHCYLYRSEILRMFLNLDVIPRRWFRQTVTA
ncbi:hypothetical protein NEUTE1DRAFT_52747 [Neurospora tetrasperma FGSC 2508]|uniref:Uncharacterized protein n=1 Tax=Neurospora tetrasperma (strain FGSC 2508 / ATCC MYA-4615 / P0657) TaxID=510951 RepID=F8MZD5_NEUT8|nr:uncharacterized protein NEUTE1DRAFT_52747 [Neurospora tetrasperma FGSC 2508]EGO52026.1 hypothetical protein NEUTE1DRAFT_52747 [Neurospora tetrasperma FGSC 2508]